VRNGQPRLDVAAMIGQEDDLVHFIVIRDALGDLDELLAKGV
jgi:hypothetical protein